MQVDLRQSIAAKLPWMAGLAITATFILLFLAFCSFVLPLKAVVMNVLSLGRWSWWAPAPLSRWQERLNIH